LITFKIKVLKKMQCSEPGIVMNGAANINFQLTANGAPATILANSFICVIQRGILLQNVTTVK
jgi:hypothetical protein